MFCDMFAYGFLNGRRQRYSSRRKAECTEFLLIRDLGNVAIELDCSAGVKQAADLYKTPVIPFLF